MQNCWSKGYIRVCFEGDNKEVTKLLTGQKLNFGIFNWIREARRWRFRFTNCKFSCCKRDNNKPTDHLAKHHLPINTSFVFS
ncbi:putative ribonuclease H domain-containing protein [Arabidopsis thaliana]